jgi:hypothetical protein
MLGVISGHETKEQGPPDDARPLGGRVPFVLPVKARFILPNRNSTRTRLISSITFHKDTVDGGLCRVPVSSTQSRFRPADRDLPLLFLAVPLLPSSSALLQLSLSLSLSLEPPIVSAGMRISTIALLLGALAACEPSVAPTLDSYPDDLGAVAVQEKRGEANDDGGPYLWIRNPQYLRQLLQRLARHSSRRPPKTKLPESRKRGGWDAGEDLSYLREELAPH